MVALLPAMLAAWLDSRLLASLSRELTMRNATVLANGLSNAYPGHGGYPAGFDPRSRPWFAAQRAQPGLRWYRPHVDATTGALVINATLPLFDARGQFIGITGIDLDLMAALDTVRLPRDVRRGSEVLLAAVLDADADDTPEVVVLASRQDGQAHDAWQTLPELAPLALGDRDTSAALRAALVRGESGELRTVIDGAAFNRMVPQLAEHARVTDALLLAREVQQQMLPAGPPQIAGYEISGITLYSEQTGGDYYDFVALDGPEAGRLAVVVADVSGHGCAPRPFRDHVHARARSVCAAHRVGQRRARSGLALPRRHRREHRVGRARHPAGVEGDWRHGVAGQGVLAAGDVVVIGTDGLWDAANAAGERFGKHRLRAFIEAQAATGAELIRDELCASVRRFRGATAQADDITIVVVKRLARAGA